MSFRFCIPEIRFSENNFYQFEKFWSTELSFQVHLRTDKNGTINNFETLRMLTRFIIGCRAQSIDPWLWRNRLMHKFRNSRVTRLEKDLLVSRVNTRQASPPPHHPSSCAPQCTPRGTYHLREATGAYR